MEFCSEPPELITDSFIPQKVGISPSYAVVTTSKIWPRGSDLNIYFMDGTDAQKDIAASRFYEWYQGHDLDLNLNFVDNPEDSNIRITFSRPDAWSYIGTDCRLIPKDQPTMSLGFDAGNHEFGHALGFNHEHQNPNGGIKWNRDVVIRSLSGAPNYWDLVKIEHNVLNKLDETKIWSSPFDELSVMLYFFPDSWVKNRKGTKRNKVLSKGDLLAASRFYGRQSKPTEPVDRKEKLPTTAWYMTGILLILAIIAMAWRQ